ncbi:hypothetical protein [Leisingera methylohalidivorans]|uniref:Uncharacterized protein n=1 Tax=Leisingera methylohalidivorans DSM 14336 TaxID=999552 RepID=V9W197_9RHOB|nr:hypothetical protein [Leisingera methylohalidivorans]AHD02942.1 hypothetical protein METH_06840 [Leisingera methylohalidivorans DSM 14336]
MKVKITQKGVFDQKGERVEVGEVLTVKGGKMPPHLIGKAVELDAAPGEGKVPVTNPNKDT